MGARLLLILHTALFACALSGPSLHARHVRFVYQVHIVLKYNNATKFRCMLAVDSMLTLTLLGLAQYCNDRLPCGDVLGHQGVVMHRYADRNKRSLYTAQI